MKERRQSEYKKGKSQSLAGLSRPEMRKAKVTKDPRFFDPDKYKGDAAWIFPCLPKVAEKYGKVAATVALCLFAFLVPAQNRVLHIAPGQAIFSVGRDTVDTNAFPAFFRALGADSAAALVRTAVVLAHIERTKSVDQLDAYLIRDLQGIGLKQYVWFRGWIIACADAREEYTGTKHNRR